MAAILRRMPLFRCFRFALAKSGRIFSLKASENSWVHSPGPARALSMASRTSAAAALRSASVKVKLFILPLLFQFLPQGLLRPPDELLGRAPAEAHHPGDLLCAVAAVVS